MTAVLSNTMFIALSLLAQAAWDVVSMADGALSAVIATIAANVELLSLWLTTLAKSAAVVAAVAIVAANPTIIVAGALIVAYGWMTWR